LNEGNILVQVKALGCWAVFYTVGTHNRNNRRSID